MFQGGHKKPVPKKTRREKKDTKCALGQAQLRSPAGTLNKLLKTATDRTKAELRGSLPKSVPLDFELEKTFALYF